MPPTCQVSEGMVWSRRQAAVAVAVVVYVAVQVLVPIAAIWGPKPARFAWHMYAYPGLEPSQYELVLQDGTHERVDPLDFVGHERGDLQLDDRLPAHLCRVNPQARAVLIRPVSTEAREREELCS